MATKKQHDPREALTADEVWAMRDKVLAVVRKTVGASEKNCPVGSEGKYPVCEHCWALHMACYTDPFCVDHG